MLIHIIMEILENIIKLIYYTMFILCTVMYSYDNSQSIYQDRDLVYLDNKIIFFSYFSSSFLILLV